jgi:hypothetical protein
MRPLLLVYLLFVFNLEVQAQLEVYPSNEIPVAFPNGNQMPNPWTGGFNAAQLSLFDADGDGNNDDIFLFDRAGNRITVFTGQDVEGERIYTFAPQASMQFPMLRNWALMRDFNCDGKVDIFTQSELGGGFGAYANTTEVAGELTFELEEILIESAYIFQNSSFSANIYNSALDIPAIIDIDGDGDLDIFTFSVTGTQMEFHENLGIDNTGTCGIDEFRAASLCYGQFNEGAESNEVALGQACFNILNPKSSVNEGSRHVGTSMMVHDLNADNVPDIVLGGVTYSNATFLENSTGSNGVDSVVDYQTNFPADFGGPAIDLDNFVAFYYEDITGDGIKDLVVGVNEAFTARNTRSLWLYENLGADNAPVLNFVQQDFLQDGTIDHGEVAVPVFTDVNGDGLADMVIGSRGEFLQSSSFVPSLSLYLNTGSLDNPAFQLEDSDWLQVADIGFGQYVHPTFGDIDGDGDTDLVIGDLSGSAFLLLNTAGPGNAMSFELGGALSADGAVIDVGQQSTPQLYDLDADGKLDLIIGERNGNINYFRNQSSNQGSFDFTLITDTLGGLSTVEFGFFIGSSAPHFFKHDNTTYLLIGVESGKLHLYSGIDGNENGDYVLESQNAFDIDAGEKSRVFVTDIDADGQPDIFCGSIGGGVLYFAGGTSMAVNTAQQAKRNKPELYPNPVKDNLRIKADQSMAGAVDYRIFNLQGALVQRGALHGVQPEISVSNLPQGSYIIEIENGIMAQRALFIKL